MKSESDLSELYIKGTLSEKGLLKESYSDETGDLKHELTPEGRNEIKEILKDPHYQKIFMRMALEEAEQRPEIAKEIVRSAINKLK